jgi:hypothetical protein
MEHGKKKAMMAQGGMMDDDMKMMPGGGHMKEMEHGGMMHDMQEGGMSTEKSGRDDNMGGQPPIDDKKKAQVMKMLDGLKEMPPEDQLVGMIAKAVRVSEDEARMIVDEYKASKKMGMGGAMEYEGGGMMKMMRDPKDMVGMTMAGGAKIIS